MNAKEGRGKTRTTILLENGLFHATGLILILFLKEYYSTAEASGLRWIMGPVSGIVSGLTGTTFEWLPGSGYVDHLHGVVMAPACAGVNFLIICFGTLYFTFVLRWRSQPEKCFWLLASAGIAYLATLLANSLRIVLSIRLYGAPIYSDLLTPGRLHQLAGIVIFLALLLAAWLIADRMLPPRNAPGSGSRSPLSPLLPLAPFAWYILVTVVVPLFNGAAGKFGASFAEHSMMVVLACGGLFLATVLTKKKVDRAGQTKEPAVRTVSNAVAHATTPSQRKTVDRKAEFSGMYRI